MNKKLLIIALLVGILLVGGCTKSIKDVKSDEYLNKEVTIKGTVKNTIKIGSLSGYTLTDKNGDEIGIASDLLPSEGSTKTITGTVKKLPLINTYYIDTN
jgi:hypothetical protein